MQENKSGSQERWGANIFAVLRAFGVVMNRVDSPKHLLLFSHLMKRQPFQTDESFERSYLLVAAMVFRAQLQGLLRKKSSTLSTYFVGSPAEKFKWLRKSEGINSISPSLTQCIASFLPTVIDTLIHQLRKIEERLYPKPPKANYNLTPMKSYYTSINAIKQVIEKAVALHYESTSPLLEQLSRGNNQIDNERCWRLFICYYDRVVECLGMPEHQLHEFPHPDGPRPILLSSDGTPFLADEIGAKIDSEEPFYAPDGKTQITRNNWHNFYVRDLLNEQYNFQTHNFPPPSSPTPPAAQPQKPQQPQATHQPHPETTPHPTRRPRSQATHFRTPQPPQKEKPQTPRPCAIL